MLTPAEPKVELQPFTRVDSGFTEMELEALDLAVFRFNTGATACYRRVGFRSMGPTSAPLEFRGEQWSGLLMGMERDVWERESSPATNRGVV